MALDRDVEILQRRLRIALLEIACGSGQRLHDLSAGCVDRLAFEATGDVLQAMADRTHRARSDFVGAVEELPDRILCERFRALLQRAIVRRIELVVLGWAHLCHGLATSTKVI